MRPYDFTHEATNSQWRGSQLGDASQFVGAHFSEPALQSWARRQGGRIEMRPYDFTCKATTGWHRQSRARRARQGGRIEMRPYENTKGSIANRRGSLQ